MSVSRRQVAKYTASQLVSGESRKKIAAYLAAYVSENKLQRNLDLLISDIEYFLQVEFEHTTVHIGSAHEISTEIKKAVLSTLKLTNKNTQVETYTDEDMLGGIVVTSGGKEFDGSLKNSLKKLATIAEEGV